ncbi:hypothetical protein HDU79_002135 [Rhizoclosmatium sp. JEL0117]|nr:hypothetical protein HDU79_002135 [Rhizoclosmatium sp. JEL0117]
MEDPTDAIDPSLVYALHTFVANVEGQVCVLKGDSLKLLDDTNYYWWLVKCVKTEEIGYIPAENIETPSERLARLNKFKNVQETLANAVDQAEPPATVDPTKPRLVFADSAIVFENYDDIDYDDDEEEEDGGEDVPAAGGGGGGAVSAGAAAAAAAAQGDAGVKAGGGVAAGGAAGVPQASGNKDDEKKRNPSVSLGGGLFKKLFNNAPAAAKSPTSPTSPDAKTAPAASKSEAPKQSINVLRIYTGNVDLKATYKAVALLPDMTTTQLLEVALKRFRVDNADASTYFLSVLFMDSGEKPLEPSAIVFNALEALKNKNLPGVANFNKIEGKAKTSLMMNDDNIIKVIINKRMNIFEKDFHLIRVFQLDPLDKTGKARTYKTIGVKLNAGLEEVTEIVKEKFKVGNDVNLKYYLSTKLKSEDQETRRSPDEKIRDILATKDGEPVEVEFILRNEPASPETVRKQKLAAQNAPPTISTTATSTPAMSFLDNGGSGGNSVTSRSPSPSPVGEDGIDRSSSYSEDVEPSHSERGSLSSDARSRNQSNQSGANYVLESSGGQAKKAATDRTSSGGSGVAADAESKSSKPAVKS